MNGEIMEMKINEHTETLKEHDKRLDKIEQNQSRTDTKIENLCDQLKQLVSVLKWYIGLTVGALVSFFFYAIQHNVFK
ncbi:hemolysin XhlA family protein [Clostridium tepidum]|uniref:hemolysin XhlA family protein n=1 Tax=Clostridium tepidum TaxID=1962263 RepID=UPI00358DBDAE